MATTGAQLEVPHIVNTSGATVGQGTQPEAWILYSTDDASVSTPTWNDATPKVKSFSTSRGRENELSEIDAGTASIVLDNRARTFDPVSNAAIRPLNQWWIREQFTGETQDIFKGYAESYQQSWPAPVGDAETTVSCSDEFKILVLDRLPTMDPPRDTYADLVNSDIPLSYWRFHDFKNLSGDPGPAWYVPATGGYGITSAVGSIIGQSEPDLGNLVMSGTGNKLETAREAFDTQGSSSMSVEFWFKFSAAPGSNQIFLNGSTQTTPLSRNFSFQMNTTGILQFNAQNSGAGGIAVTSSALTANTWYHAAGTIGGGGIFLTINGVGVDSDTFSGSLSVSDDDSFPPTIEWNDAGTSISLDELAFYPARDIGSARILAHYQAGALRGFPDSQLPGTRANAVLDASTSDAPRLIQAGTRTMRGVFMHGQDPLEELRKCKTADAVDALLFVARDGTVTFLADGHRSSSPYNTVQATFDDDGTDLPYLDGSLTLDYSEAFLFNEWNVTPEGQSVPAVATASDSTSISRYKKRSQSLSAPITLQADATAIAAAMLAKYKDPLTRITSITLTTDVADAAEAIFRRDIGDRIRILRTPPGGGTRHDQTSFIQKISVDAQPGVPWRVTWAVSPL